jgi:hypothetical protein
MALCEDESCGLARVTSDKPPAFFYQDNLA